MVPRGGAPYSNKFNDLQHCGTARKPIVFHCIISWVSHLLDVRRPWADPLALSPDQPSECRAKRHLASVAPEAKNLDVRGTSLVRRPHRKKSLLISDLWFAPGHARQAETSPQTGRTAGQPSGFIEIIGQRVVETPSWCVHLYSVATYSNRNRGAPEWVPSVRLASTFMERCVVYRSIEPIHDPISYFSRSFQRAW